ncbi:MAG TPA: immunoglobulin domain-containing protein, partial [Verrucomicrobiae bacterium]|nr:immunoglobulin domain-containing protein [Verrucomicrobiae bacterium]
FQWNLLPVLNPLTRITAQPVDQSAPLGDRVTFDVNFQIFEPARVQWLRDGILVRDVPAGGSDRLEFASLTRADVGNYLCRIVPLAVPEDSVLQVQSRVIRLQVHRRGDGTVIRDIFSRDKLFEAADAAAVQLGGQSLQKSKKRKQAGGPATGYTGTQIFSTFGSTREPGEPNHCGVAGGASEWYSYVPPTNGVLRVNTDGSDFDTVLAVYVVPAGQPVTYGNLQSVACDNDSGVNGRSSAVTFSALANEICYIAVDGVNGEMGTAELHYELGVPPVITQQPAGQTVSVGSAVTLNVNATGFPAPSFQWQRNQVHVPGATNISLTITNFQAANQGTYRVLASNSTGSALSASATLLLDSPLRWSSVSVDGSGLFHLQLAGPGNTNYIVLASTDLTSWTPLATNNVPNGIWDYVDATGTNFRYRFYRALQSP